MRSDTKHTLQLLTVVIIAAVCVGWAYVDRETLLKETERSMQQVELLKAELEGVCADEGDTNPYPDEETAKQHRWQTGYMLKHGTAEADE